MLEIAHHLICGWQGFIRILRQITDAKVKLPAADVELLEAMKAELDEVLAKQSRL